MFPNDPLTDKDLDELDQFLLDLEGVDNSMDVSTLDGYFAALISGPKTILPSEWMRWVWDMEAGEQGPTFATAGDAERLLGLIMRHMNMTARTLFDAPERFEPLILESPGDGDPVPVIDEWCSGFMRGVLLDPEGWRPVTEGHTEWLATIRLYGTPEGWAQLRRKRLSLADHRHRAAGLGDTVREVHAFFLPGRAARAMAGSTTIVRSQADKVGRNDPCPCGSGKKYKLCHGAPGRPH